MVSLQAIAHSGGTYEQGCHAGGQPYHCHHVALTSYQVINIVDGDTVAVTEAGKKIKIRLAGIDCPEKRQPWGKKAKQAISDYVAGKAVSIEKTDTDRYDRTVARVYVDGENINHALVRDGHCWVYKKYAKDKKLFELEKAARDNQRGLWALPENQRMPPWEWRRR